MKKILQGQSQLITPLNAELNPICHLLALLGAHHILHVSRVRVNIMRQIFCISGKVIENFVASIIGSIVIRGVAIKKPDSCSNPLLKKNQTIEMLSPSM